MDMQQQITYLNDQINGQILSFKKNRISNKKKAFYFQISTLLLASTSSIILGLNSTEYAEVARIAVLIITTIISVLSGIDTYFNHKKLWIYQAETLNHLYALKLDFEFTCLGTITKDDLSLYKDRFNSILDSSNNRWMKLRENNTDK